MSRLDLTHAIVDIELVATTDTTFTITVYARNGANTPTPQDLTGYQVLFTARDGIGGAVAIQVTGVLLTQSGDTLGQATITVPRAMVPDPARLDYEIRTISGAGKENVPIQGTLTILPAVGKP